jgi:hypothetical protein
LRRWRDILAHSRKLTSYFLSGQMCCRYLTP